MNLLQMILGRNGKSSSSIGRDGTIVRNSYSYNVPNMFGKNASTNKNHKFYNSTVQAISIGGVDCATKVGSLCDPFFYGIPG